MAVTESEGDAVWAPSAEVIGSLLTRLIGDVPSTQHRRALEATSQAFTMTEDLLRAALPEQDSAALFAWLRELPFVESVAHGLHPHDAAREALAAGLRWRDPQTFADMRERLTGRMLQQFHEVSAADAVAAVSELLYLYREVPIVAAMYAWERHGQVEDGPVRAEDLPTVLAMAVTTEGEESAALTRFWYERQPEAFALYRLLDSGKPVAFSVRLQLFEPDEAEVAADPVVAAAWEHCRTAPMAAGEYLVMTRFAVHPGRYQQPSPVHNLMHWRALGDIARSTRLAHGFLVYRDAEAWQQRLGHTMADVGARPVVGGRSYALFTNDWRRTPFAQWLSSGVRPAEAAAAVPRAPQGPVLPREQFDEAVRQALLLWGQRNGLAGSRLSVTALVPSDDEHVDEALRRALNQALDSLRTDPHRLQGRNAVIATYLAGASTQQAAAHRLGVPFSTYRRHLKQGLQDLCDRLWETASAPHR